MPVGRLLREHSAFELMEWQAFESVCGPLPLTRADYHAAQVTAAMANLHGRDAKKTPQPFPVEDFVMWAPPKPPPEMTWQEAKANFMAATRSAPGEPPSPKVSPRKRRTPTK